MNWLHPWALVLIPALAPLVWWFHRRTRTPLSPRRKNCLLAARLSTLVLVVSALAAPAIAWPSAGRAVIFVLDHSRSQSVVGLSAAIAHGRELMQSLPEPTQTAVISTGASASLLQEFGLATSLTVDERLNDLLETDGAQSDVEAGLRLAINLLPAGAMRRIVYLGDGLETRGDAQRAAEEAALAGIPIDVVPIPGPVQRDIRVLALRPHRTRLPVGAALRLEAVVESSFAVTGNLELLENGIVVGNQSLVLEAGEQQTLLFQRTAAEQKLYRYTARLTNAPADGLPENDQARAVVDVYGEAVLLFVEGEESAAAALPRAMAAQEIRLDSRTAAAFPATLAELSAYAGVVLSDVTADQFTDAQLQCLHDYVETLGGGLLVIGGLNTATAGAYTQSPVEDMLPVRIPNPDREEKLSVALTLVIDKSGSMEGEKLRLSKSAAVSTTDLLTDLDQLCVIAFDGAATTVVPMTPVTSRSALRARLASLNAGGGTNLYPAILKARQALVETQARIKHMIVLSDGQTEGADYEALARGTRQQQITISTVAVGSRADRDLLQSIARLGGGQYYETQDPTAIPRIFTQDTTNYTRRALEETSFTPQLNDRHAAFDGWVDEWSRKASPLLGYVRAIPKSTAVVPLVTEDGDPLLAFWQYGLGRVAMFTSDCKPRWATLWLSQWPEGYSEFWTHVVRDVSRETPNWLMDMQLSEDDHAVRVGVDVLQNADTFSTAAAVSAQVFLLGDSTADESTVTASTMQPYTRIDLVQVGPGRYEGKFHCDGNGIYVVRCDSEVGSVSGTLVRSTSREASTGKVNLTLLNALTSTSGGRILEPNADRLLTEDRVISKSDPFQANPQVSLRMYELRPWLLVLALLTFLADILARRWGSVLTLAAAIGIGRRAAIITVSLCLSAASGGQSLFAQAPDVAPHGNPISLPSGFLCKATAATSDGIAFCIGTGNSGDQLLILRGNEDDRPQALHVVPFPRRESLVPTLACDERAVYVVIQTQLDLRHSQCELAAFDHVGQLQWRAAPLRNADPVCLAVGPDRQVMVGTSDSTIHCFAHDATPRWKFAQPAGAVVDLACDLDGTVYAVFRSDGPPSSTRVCAVDAAGALRWRRDVNETSGTRDRTRCQIALDSDGCVLLVQPRQVLKLDASGRPLWTCSIPGNLQIVQGPLIDNSGKIFLTASSGHVFRTGRPPHFALVVDERGTLQSPVQIDHTPADAMLSPDGLRIVGLDRQHRLRETRINESGRISGSQELAAADSPFSHFYNWRLRRFLKAVPGRSPITSFVLRTSQTQHELRHSVGPWPTDDGPGPGRTNLLGDDCVPETLERIYAPELKAFQKRTPGQIIEYIQDRMTLNEEQRAKYSGRLADLDAEDFAERRSAAAALREGHSRFPCAFPEFLRSQLRPSTTAARHFHIRQLIDHHPLRWQQDPQLRELIAAVLALSRMGPVESTGVFEQTANDCPHLFIGRVCHRILNTFP